MTCARTLSPAIGCPPAYTAPPTANTPRPEQLVCLWTQEVGTGGVDHAQHVLPAACVDVIWANDEPPQVAGPATRSIVAALPPGTVLVGARFRPGASAGVLGVEASALQDLHLPLHDAPSLARHFSTAVADRQRVADRVSIVASLLARHLADAAPPDGVVRATVH